MDKHRYIKTKFWSDNFIVSLNPTERYLFLYFLTNEHTNIAGIYELPLPLMVFETKLNPQVINKSLSKLVGKVEYFEGWIYVKNFSKHQNPENPNIIEGIKRIWEELPYHIKAYIYPIHTLPIPLQQPKPIPIPLTYSIGGGTPPSIKKKA